MLRSLLLGVVRGGVVASCAMAFVGGCSNGGGDETGQSAGERCDQGDTRECVGAGACSGGQICDEDGRWGDCECGVEGDESDPDATDVDSESTDGGGDESGVDVDEGPSDGEATSPAGADTDGAGVESDGIDSTDPVRTDVGESDGSTDEVTPGTTDASDDDGSLEDETDGAGGSAGAGGAGGVEAAGGAGGSGGEDETDASTDTSEEPTEPFPNQGEPPAEGGNDLETLDPSAVELSDPLVIADWGDNARRSLPTLMDEPAIVFRAEVIHEPAGLGDDRTTFVEASSGDGRYCVEGWATMHTYYFEDRPGLVLRLGEGGTVEDPDWNWDGVVAGGVVGMVFDLEGAPEEGVVPVVDSVNSDSWTGNSAVSDGRRVILFDDFELGGVVMRPEGVGGEGLPVLRLLGDSVLQLAFAVHALPPEEPLAPFSFCVSNIRFIMRTV